MNPIDNILTRIPAKQTSPGKWLAKCPHHDDRVASLAIKHTDDGKILLHCFAGCSVEQILGAVDLTFSDLYPPKSINPDSRSKPTRRPPKFTAGELIKIANFETTVVYLALRQLLATGKINEQDLARVEQAMATIDEIRNEVARA